MDKTSESRHKAILKIISEEIISKQEKLIERLNEAGYNATQSTVSRDIKKLGIVKSSDDDGTIRYVAVYDRISEKSIFRDAVTGADYAGNTAVIKCRIGMAQAVCTTLDSMHNPEVVGTLAGDDTIFVLMRSENDAKHLSRIFKKELGL